MQALLAYLLCVVGATILWGMVIAGGMVCLIAIASYRLARWLGEGDDDPERDAGILPLRMRDKVRGWWNDMKGGSDESR